MNLNSRAVMLDHRYNTEKGLELIHEILNETRIQRQGETEWII